jgi:hypothetical protein
MVGVFVQTSVPTVRELQVCDDPGLAQLLERIEIIEREIQVLGDPTGNLDAELVCLNYSLASKCEDDE